MNYPGENVEPSIPHGEELEASEKPTLGVIIISIDNFEQIQGEHGEGGCEAVQAEIIKRLKADCRGRNYIITTYDAGKIKIKLKGISGKEEALRLASELLISVQCDDVIYHSVGKEAVAIDVNTSFGVGICPMNGDEHLEPEIIGSKAHHRASVALCVEKNSAYSPDKEVVWRENLAKKNGKKA